ncbi:MAG: LytTR family transcriptional regulator DNA-binding domain-containing protein [Bacteroidales bacterium]|nr:LytTR family transcriptional regulator DNA-binding domain-containing protein [Bacteroidales bacterium]
MSRKRLVIFICILLALLILPTTLPFILGHLVLPWWAFIYYAFIIIVNAGIYLAQRCLLIDRFLVKGRNGIYVLLSLILLIIGLGLQYLAHAVTGRIHLDNGQTVSEYLGFGVNIAQLTMMSVIQIVTTFIAIAVNLSDEWRLAAFRYNEAEKSNRALKSDVEQLKEQIDSLQRPAPRMDSISVKIDLMKKQLKLDDILYANSDGDYVLIHLSDGSAPMVLMTLKSLEKQLPYDRFCRIHRSYLVNVDKIEGLKGGKVYVAGKQLPLSESCKAAFFELLSHKSIVLHN